MPSDTPKISIGLPVYNGEFFIRKSIESILSQTFSNFELLISDNASTDATEKICREYESRDKRITYFRQKENIGPHRNYFFLLDKAKFEFFIWVASDDYLEKNYLEKNLDILLHDSNISSSVGIVKPYSSQDMGISFSNAPDYPKFIQKYVVRNRRKKMLDTESINGSYENKIRKFLKITKSLRRWYGLHRTEQLKKCIIRKPFINVEVSIFLNLLKFGNFFECKETHLYEFDEGISSKGILNTIKVSEHDFFGNIFPFLPFTSWCLRNLGVNLFLKNLDTFFMMNLGGQFALLVDLLLKLKAKF